MHDVKGFPPNALDTLRMLAEFTDSFVALTVETCMTIKVSKEHVNVDECKFHSTNNLNQLFTNETRNTFSFLWTAPNAPTQAGETMVCDVLGKTAMTRKDEDGWYEFRESAMIQPFLYGRFCNLSGESASMTNRLCLLRKTLPVWNNQQLLLMDQTRHVLEDQFRSCFLDKQWDVVGNNKDKFRLLLDFSPAGIFFYNTSLKLSAFNERFTSILGASADQLLNFDLQKIRDQSVMPALKAPLSGEEGFYEGTYHATFSQKTVDIQMKTAPILNKAGKITGIIGIVQDNTERIKTLRELEENKNRLHVLINATPDIICFKDAEGRWIEANESIQQLFRLKGKDFLFKSDEHLKKLVPELSGIFEQCRKTDEEAWRRKHPITIEEILPLPNGDERTLDVIKTPVFDENGQKKGLVVLGRDISARKKAEELLRESEQRFRNMTMHANDIIFEWEPQTDRINWSGKTGYIAPEEDPPNTFSEFAKFIHPDDRDRIVRFWTEKFPGEEEWKDEFRVNNKKDTIKYFRGNGIMLFKNGHPHKVIGTLTSVTQEKMLINSLKEAVEEAQHNQARITGLLAVIPDMIFVFDHKGYIIDYHAHDDHSLYVTPENFIDQQIDQVLPPDIATLTHKKIDDTRKHKKVETYEYLLTIEGEPKTYESRMVFVDDDRYLCIVRDVTHARKVEQELRKAKEQAEKSDHLKSAFLANMSHEIRTPMNGILGFSELLKNKNLSDTERANCIDIIIKSGQQLLSIINDVLDISQLETGQVSVMRDRVNLTRLITDLARFFEMEAAERSVELRYHIPAEDVFEHVDGGKLTQILNNLLSNAFKFTSPGGHIEFGFEKKPDHILFFVHDDGIGIAPKHHQIIFERFGQVLKVGAKNKGGTGLGLSICKSLTELMGGEIWVESETGHGASFFFTIPLIPYVHPSQPT